MSDMKDKLKCFIDFCYMDNDINFESGKDYALSDRLRISNPKMLIMWDIWSDGYDQLVEENAELREALQSIIDDVGVVYSQTGRFGGDEKNYTITEGEIEDLKQLLEKRKE